MGNIEKNQPAVSGCVDYYRAVSERVLPYLKRGISAVKRYPHGPTGGYFYYHDLQQLPTDFRESLGVSDSGPLVCDDADTLLKWVDRGVMGFYLHGGSTQQPPKWLSWQLESHPDTEFSRVIQVAKTFIEVLRDDSPHRDMPIYLKTSEGWGLDVVMAVNGLGVTETQGTESLMALNLLAQQQMQRAQQQIPDVCLGRTMSEQDKFTNTVYIHSPVFDETQAGVLGGATTSGGAMLGMLAPYSVSNLEKPLISAPVTLAELSNPEKPLTPNDFTPEVVIHRLETQGDLWKDLLKF